MSFSAKSFLPLQEQQLKKEKIQIAFIFVESLYYYLEDFTPKCIHSSSVAQDL
jgi:hypothetical protein